MANRVFPRYLTLVPVLTLVGIAVILSIFYGQYSWLTTGIVTSSVERHGDSLTASFERRARGQLYRTALELSEFSGDGIRIRQQVLDAAVGSSDILEGLRYTMPDGTVLQSGTNEAEPAETATVWADGLLLMRLPVGPDDGDLGELFGSFSLQSVVAETEAFEAELVSIGSRGRNTGLFWIAIATVATVAGCGAIIWTIARIQAQRIYQLKIQAEKLSDSDYGEPLEVVSDDLLGDLAAVFNDMRDRLKQTTVSRDYVDSVLSSINEAIIVTSADGTITRANAATSRMLGYLNDELVGRHIDSIVDQGRSLRVDMRAGLPDESVLLTRDGDRVPVSYTGSTIEAGRDFCGHRIYAAQNITERRKAQQRMRYLARIDALTKIPNRMQFQHLLQRAIAKAKKSGRTVALFYIDIDQFKEINDTFGHLAGDATLETVAQRLSGALPRNTVVGRLAGDEFAVIVDRVGLDSEPRDALGRIAHSLLEKLAEPFEVQGHEVFMTASMGIAFYPADAWNVIDLIRNADAALYHAKKSGGNAHSYYLPRMNEASVERLMTKSKLRRAFERDELLVHYQPKFDLRTGRLAGAEALVRWELPERGIILPSDFIPLAEETNLIIEIGEWVFDRVCEDFRNWQTVVASPARVSVNLSLKQLRQPNFIKRICAIMLGYQVSPTSFELEITETTLMEKPERTIKILDDLYALGLSLAIDDFGTGYSSLSALQQFPIDTLKIDKSFVRDIATNSDDATIVGTIIDMGRNLNIEVVAEGVESEEQLAFLQSLGCAYAQGLLFGDPMSADNYRELLLAGADGTGGHRVLLP